MTPPGHGINARDVPQARLDILDWLVAPPTRSLLEQFGRPRAHEAGDCEHEDRIVPGHIKGPADMPLRIGETVNLWDHQPE